MMLGTEQEVAMLVYKHIPVGKGGMEVKVEGDGRTVFGYASVFGPPADSDNEVVDRGAFSKTLAEKPVESKRIKFMWMHKDPFGLPVVLKEDRKGLYFEAQVASGPISDERLDMLKMGAVDGVSIGFRVIKPSFADMVLETEDPKAKPGPRHLKELDLREISPVVFGANSRAGVLGVKSGELEPEVFAQLIEQAYALVKKGGVLVPKQETQGDTDETKTQDRPYEITTVLDALTKATEAITTVSDQLKALDTDRSEPSQSDTPPDQDEPPPPEPTVTVDPAVLQSLRTGLDNTIASLRRN